MKIKHKKPITTIEQADEIFAKIAQKEHTTVEEVKKEIKRAMWFGMADTTPTVREEWAKIPHAGETITEEEFLIYMVNKVSNK
ncbi:MAG: sporulation initiation factor Spo0A [Lachnospiraceae bacterium]|nr:sporulation initiation factor Spo0A [Lachnospiraceae bacterium]